jgi:hypothetical protein
MENRNTLAGFALAVAVVALIVAGLTFSMKAAPLGGSVIESQQTDFQNGMKINSVLLERVLFGAANASTSALPLEATSTDSFTLSVTGVTTASRCSVMLPNYDPGVYGGLSISGITTTADTITFGIQNNTGAATSSFRSATTSVAYYCVR